MMTGLPAYLDTPRRIDDRTFGRLIRSDNRWIIEGEPPVIQLAKRLFPGSDGRERGKASFPVAKRLIGDLNWLMMRYPLIIDDQAAWECALAEARAHESRSIEVRRSLTPMVPPAEAFTGELRPFQQEGLSWLTHYRRTLLADEMGLGKTVQALAFLASASAFPCLIICQPHLVRQWERAIARFLPGVGHDVLEGMTPRESLAWPVTLIHYGLLRSWRHHLVGRFASVIFDEIQELRHRGTLKYSAAHEIAQSSETVIGLSGTPIYNKGAEIWNVLNVIEMHCLGDFDSFTREWCIGYGSEIVANPDHLGSVLREQGLLLRRRKVDVIKDLPPKHRVIEEIDADAGTFGELIQPAMQLLQQEQAAETPFERGRLREEIINVARRATGVAKAPHVARFVEALLDAGESVLVFAHHHDVVDRLTVDIGRRHRLVRITGRESKGQKDAAQQAFQNGSTPCCIVSLRAAAGLDLYRAKCVVFAELDWSPAVHSQAEDRAHRIGQQHDSVLAYYLVWHGDGSSDPDVLERLGFKVQQFVGLMQDAEPTATEKTLATESARDHMTRIVERLRALRRAA